MELSKIGETALVRNADLPINADPWCIAVSLAVEAMHSALNTFGKKCDGSLIQVWMLVLQKADVTTPEIYDAMMHWVSEESDFPTPREVSEWILTRRRAIKDQERLRLSGIADAEEKEREFETRQEKRFGPNWREMSFEERRALWPAARALVRGLFGVDPHPPIKEMPKGDK